MSFDNAMTILLAKEGQAAKTRSMVGFLVRTAVPVGSSADYCISMRYRGSSYPYSASPVYQLRESDDGDLVVISSSNECDLDSEFMSLMMSDDWYTGDVVAFTEALEKARSASYTARDAVLHVDPTAVISDSKSFLEHLPGITDGQTPGNLMETN